MTDFEDPRRAMERSAAELFVRRHPGVTVERVLAVWDRGGSLSKELERERWARRRERRRAARVFATDACLFCGGPMPAKRRVEMRFCSTKCRVAAHRQREF